MRSGPLRHLATLRRRSETRTTAGGYTETWSSLGHSYVEIRPMERGREYARAGAMASDVTHQIFMHWTSSVTLLPKDQLTYDGRTFHIVSAVNVGERNRMVEILAKEVV